MKTKLFLFAFCFIFINNAFAINKATEFKASFNPPTIPSLIQVCDDDGLPNDGFSEFNIDYYVGNISGYTIEYFSDAAHSTSIYSPYVNEVSQNQTIYYTITDGAAYTASGTITLVVIPVPTPRVFPPVINGCDDSFNDGYAIVDLTQNASYILNGQTHAQLLYYTNYYDAFQGGTTSAGYISTPTAANVNGDVYVRVQWDPNYYVNFISSDGQPCAVVVAQPVTVHPLIFIPELNPLIACDDNGDGYAIANLCQKDAEVLAGQPASAYTISYHATSTDAITGVNPLPCNYANNNPSTIIYVRKTNNVTGCARTQSFEIIISPAPTLPNPLSNYNVCDNTGSYDGCTYVDLYGVNSGILDLQSLPPANYNILYYLTESDAIAGQNSIMGAGQHYVCNNTTIWVKVINIGTGCYAISSFNVVVNPQQILPPLTPLVACDDNGDGYKMFNLCSKNAEVLAGAPASENTITYHSTSMDAEYGANPLPCNYSNMVAFAQIVYVRKRHNVSGCVTISSFILRVEILPTPVITTNTDVLCIDFTTGMPLNNPTLTAVNNSYYPNNSTVPTYTYQWYQNGVPIVGATNSTYTIAALSPGMSHDFTVSMTTTTPGFTCSATSSPQTINVSSPASAVGAGYSIVDNAGNQTVTVLVQGFGIYEYSLDSGPRQTSNVFTNVPLGNHSIVVWDVSSSMYGCNPLVIEIVVVANAVTPAPTGSSDQFFTQGQTLANLVVNGQNIQWYASATGNKNSSSVAALPSNTLLQDNVTYYATQQVGGYESIDRLPVTAHLVLANANFQSNFAALFPNPANDVLNVKSKESIRKIEITNLLGQKVLTQEVNNIEFSISIDKLPAQQYLVTLFSDSGKTQVVKIIKK